MPNNPVMAARFGYLTTCQDNRLARQQARTACAAALLRWIRVVVTRHIPWDPAIAAGSLEEPTSRMSMGSRQIAHHVGKLGIDLKRS
jgi:hypothetical protein